MQYYVFLCVTCRVAELPLTRSGLAKVLRGKGSELRGVLRGAACLARTLCGPHFILRELRGR